VVKYIILKTKGEIWMSKYVDNSFQVRSRGMYRMLASMDDYILNLEEENDYLTEEVEKLRKENSKYVDMAFQNSMNSMANTLNAIMATPKLDVLSTVILDKIRNMNDIDEIKSYIEEVFEENIEKGE
jgi:hypothetical protein